MQAFSITICGLRHQYYASVPDAPGFPPVIALHGFGTSGYATFRHVAPHFQQAGIPLYALDLLGFGQSDKPDRIYSLTHYAESITGFIETLMLSRPVILGHSMGGKIAAATVARNPQCFSGLILANSAGFSPFARLLPPLASASWIHKLFSQDWFFQKILPKTLLGPVFSRPESRSQFLRLHSSHYALDLDYTGIRLLFKSLNIPALVVWGQNDTLLPEKFAHHTRRAFPNAELVMLSNAGHAPMKNHPEQFTSVVMNFLRRHTPS